MSENQAQWHDELPADSPYALLCRYAEMYVNVGPQQDNQDYSASSYLGFGVAEQSFLLRVSEVRSVLNELPYLTHLPFAPSWLLGLSSVRGEIVSVVAFAQIVGEQNAKPAAGSRSHYILLGGDGTGFLLKVDRLYGISRLGIEEALGKPAADDKPFVNARASFEGREWQRISLGKLLETALTE